jgi:hypothetical protein
MVEKEMKLKVENYIGFDDDGYLECVIFVGKEDQPIINHKFSMKDIIKEFIDIRSNKAGFDKMYASQRDLVVKTLEKSIETLKKAA